MKHGTMGFRPLLALGALLLYASQAPGEPPKPGSLPEPLTLEHALSLAGEPHPDLERAAAGIDLARAGRLEADALTSLRSSVEAEARWVEPSSAAANQSHADHRVSLFVRKRLYDFGRSDSLTSAAESDIKSKELLYMDVGNQRRIDILARYLKVLLADLEFIRDNEAMAVEFVGLDRLRDRNELGQVSDIEVREKQVSYEAVRRARVASQARQRATRARLALALNRPTMLSSTLATPALHDLERELPEVEQLHVAALKDNPVLRALRAQMVAAQQRVKAARAGGGPTLTGEFEASAYERQFGSRDDLRAGVTLEVPLSKGGAVEAEVARRLAELRQFEAELAARKMEVRQAVLEIWLELETLRIQRDEARAALDYRDLYLDRSRALYEMEVKTDLGDSMVQLSSARLKQAETDFAIILAWARLDALLGKTVYSTKERSQ